MTVSALGDLTYSCYEWTGHGAPEVSLGDPLWMASYLAMIAGIWDLSRTGAGKGLDVDAIIDSLVAVVVVTFVLWEVALAELMEDGSISLASKLVWTSYPAMDVVLLALLVHLMINRTRSWNPSLILLVTGTAAWLAADFAYVVGSGADNRALDVAWMVGPFLIGSAACCAAPVGSRGPQSRPQGRIWLVLWPLALPLVFEVQGFASGRDPNPVGPVLATLSLLALGSVRGHRLVRAADRAHDVMEQSQKYFQALAANSVDAGLVIDERSTVLSGFGNVDAVLGIGQEEVAGAEAAGALGALEPAQIDRLLSQSLRAPHQVVEADIEAVRADGGRRWLAVRAINLLDDPAVAGIALNLHDVTDAKRATEELERQALHDGLTNLANHSLFIDRLDHALSRGDRTGSRPSVLFIDIDGFKSVNDRFGHGAGDILLKQIAGRLLATVRSSDTLGRIGGDEFAVLLEDNHHQTDEVMTTAERVLQAMSTPFSLGDELLSISASVGVATAEGSTTPEQLLRSADVAMYQAKRNGKARIDVYDQAMGAQASELTQIEHGIEHALERRELALHYQPVVELASGRIVGFEALLRWHHPTLGLLPPDRFIPVLEKTGLIVPVGRWVLLTACETAATWAASPGSTTPMTVAVNVSGRQLESDDIIDDVADALDRSGIPAASLVLEMTETALVADPVGGARRLETLHDLGVRLAVDDFGTGYSSLNYLRLFPIDILKIDRSFIETITDAADLPPIVRGLLDLGHTLDLEIIAEGIEEPVQSAGLLAEQCGLGQGYLFSRAVPPKDVPGLLRSIQSDLPSTARST